MPGMTKGPPMTDEEWQRTVAAQTAAADLPTIPLPDHLLDGSCGCPAAKNGHHLTSCRPAREHDDIPLDQRDGYQLGRRFQGVIWKYPLEIRVDVTVRIEIDPVAYIAAHRDDYEEFELDRGYEDWEKPMQFLSARAEEDVADIGGWFTGGGRRVSTSCSSFDDWAEHPRWTAADTDRLNEALGPAPVVDPNQGTLELTPGTDD